MGEYARRIGELLGLDDAQLAMLEAAGSLHDAGKYFIADHVLDKPGSLDEAEWEAIRRHPELGAAVAREEGHGAEVEDWILHSHERLDGSGYPDRLAGDAIPLGARILAVIDAYVGMTSERAHRHAMIPGEALRELEREAGSRFDPAVVDCFVGLVWANL